MVELYFEIGATSSELINNYHLEVSQNEIFIRVRQKLFLCSKINKNRCR